MSCIFATSRFGSRRERPGERFANSGLNTFALEHLFRGPPARGLLADSGKQLIASKTPGDAKRLAADREVLAPGEIHSCCGTRLSIGRPGDAKPGFVARGGSSPTPGVTWIRSMLRAAISSVDTALRGPDRRPDRDLTGVCSYLGVPFGADDARLGLARVRGSRPRLGDRAGKIRSGRLQEGRPFSPRARSRKPFVTSCGLGI